jgi:hypothetical protein
VVQVAYVPHCVVQCLALVGLCSRDCCSLYVITCIMKCIPRLGSRMHGLVSAFCVFSLLRIRGMGGGGGGVFLEGVSRSRQRKRDFFLGTWNVRSLCMAGSHTAAARELARNKLDLVGVLEVRCDKRGTLRAASRPGRNSPPGKTQYPLYRRLSRPQGRFGQVRKISPHPDSIPRPSSP